LTNQRERNICQCCCIFVLASPTRSYLLFSKDCCGRVAAELLVRGWTLAVVATGGRWIVCSWFGLLRLYLVVGWWLGDCLLSLLTKASHKIQN